MHTQAPGSRPDPSTSSFLAPARPDKERRECGSHVSQPHREPRSSALLQPLDRMDRYARVRMVPSLLVTRSPLLARHQLLGCSTAYMEDQRGQWRELVAQAAAVSSLAVELSAISESELPGLLGYLREDPQLPFRYVSVHAPSKGRELPEAELVDVLAQLPLWVDAVVMHPDTIDDVGLFGRLGRRLVLENMDARKTGGRNAQELASFFDVLPDAGLCFDIAHARSIDASMDVGEAIIVQFAERLRHVHLSSLDADSHHVPLSLGDEELFSPLLERCRDVPWILEAPPAR